MRQADRWGILDQACILSTSLPTTPPFLQTGAADAVVPVDSMIPRWQMGPFTLVDHHHHHWPEPDLDLRGHE